MVKLSGASNDDDLTLLSDEQLFEQLQLLGVNVGPIVGSTRKVYERKLARLLNGEEEAIGQNIGHDGSPPVSLLTSSSSPQQADLHRENNIYTHMRTEEEYSPIGRNAGGQVEGVFSNEQDQPRSHSPNADYVVRSRNSINQYASRSMNTSSYSSYSPSSDASPSNNYSYRRDDDDFSPQRVQTSSSLSSGGLRVQTSSSLSSSGGLHTNKPGESSSFKAILIKSGAVFLLILFAILIYHNMENSNSNPIPRVEFN